MVSRPARKKLFEFLWKERRTVSASEFSRLARVPYATAHFELKSMEKAGLATSERVGGALLYRAATAHPQASLLTRLFEEKEEESNENTESSAVVDHLEKWGAPLYGTGEPVGSWSLEETVTKGLGLSHENATVARALPVLLYRHADSLDFEELVSRAKRMNETRALGFFLDVTAKLSGNKKFSKWAQTLVDRRVKKSEYFFKRGETKFSRLLAERNTPPLAVKWKFKMNLNMDGFETLFRKFQDGAQKIQPRRD